MNSLNPQVPDVSTDVTQLLEAIESGDPKAADQLLPLVYEELRKLAAVCMAQEKAGQTLQPTALVHEAWMKLAGSNQDRSVIRCSDITSACQGAVH